MSEPFELIDPDDAQQYLNSFDATTRRKGEAYFSEGRVRDLRCEEPGCDFRATVQGTQLYEVHLLFNDLDGWLGDCTCPMELDCKHVYAVMRAVFAEQNLAVVRDLSAGKKKKATVFPTFTPPKKIEAPPVGILAEKVVVSLARPLRGEEARFLRKLSEVYARCFKTRNITHWDFGDLGLSLGGYGWEPLKIWPSFPSNEHEFWLYIANALQQRGTPIPQFLAPVTDLRVIQDRLARWERSREIERWRGVLANRYAWESDPAPERRAACDLRLALGVREGALEWKRPGQETFERMKPRA